MSDKESFWNELGITEDDEPIEFTFAESEPAQQEPEEEKEEVIPQPPQVDPIQEKLAALEAMNQRLEQQLKAISEASRQPVSPQQAQPQPQQVQYQPTKYLTDADLLHYNQILQNNQQEQARLLHEQMHNIRVGYERQQLEATKQLLKAERPDLFKYVDEKKIEEGFANRVSKGEFGFDWRTAIETVYRHSKFADLEKAASELEQARQKKEAKQAKALKAVPTGGATYQPATSQPVAGNQRGFKSASAGFLADLGLS